MSHPSMLQVLDQLGLPPRITLVMVICVVLIILCGFLASRRWRGEEQDMREGAVSDSEDDWGSESIFERETRPSQFRCLECGEFITYGKAVCSKCGEKQKRCIVCQQFIGQEELYSKCPHCKQLAHRVHLLEWVKVKGSCPYCKEKLRKEELV